MSLPEARTSKRGSSTPTGTATPDMALEIFRRYRESHDLAIRDQLVCEHLPLVYSLARRYSAYGEQLDDLIQEGSIGLLRAVDCFDPQRGIRFSTYACHLIISRMLHYLRDCGYLIRQPAWVQELDTKVTRATRQLEQQLGREPFPREIAHHLNLTEESVREVLAARETRQVVSLTAPAEEGEDQSLLLIDREKIHQRKPKTLQLPIEVHIVLDVAIAQLQHLEQRVLRLFFYGSMTLSEISRSLCISAPRSAYLLRQSIKKIKSGLEAQRREEARLFAADPPPATAHATIPRFDKHTGVYSDAYLRIRLAEELACAEQEPVPCALVMLRLDGVEDGSDGHPMLAAVGHQLRHCLHATDITAYLGAHSFGILLLNAGTAARSVGARLGEQVSLLPPTGSRRLSARIGAAVFPDDGTTPAQLFRRAASVLDTKVR